MTHVFEDNPSGQPMRLLSLWSGWEVPDSNDGAMIVVDTEITATNVTLRCLNFWRV